MQDEMIPAKEVAVYWIEHVLRHGGTKHLQSRAKDMPFYQLYLLDVWLFLNSILLIILYVLYKIVCFFINMFSRRKIKTQ
jgi:glucuronosyltransferase